MTQPSAPASPVRSAPRHVPVASRRFGRIPLHLSLIVL